MTIQPGERLPECTLTTPSKDGPQAVSTTELFKGKTVALFAVPGAFTPTCSARHLPGFKDKKDELKSRGIDQIACLSVNDAFVMQAWGESQGVDGGEILMLADGNGEFTRKLGLELDASKFGMGERSQRYSMIVEDGVVKTLNIEEGGEFKVSSAEHLLTQL